MIERFCAFLDSSNKEITKIEKKRDRAALTCYHVSSAKFLHVFYEERQILHENSRLY